MTKQRRALRVIGAGFLGALLVVLSIPLLPAMDGAAEAATFCYPIVGPIQRFNPTLSDSLLKRVRVHERVHADQCLHDGAVWHMVRRLVTKQRLLLEAEAYCAEVRFGLSQGGQVRLLYAGALDELRDTEWFHRVSTEVLAEALASRCPGVARSALQEERDVQARWRLRRNR